MKAIYLLIGMAFTGLQASNAQEIKRIETIKIEVPCYETDLLFRALRETHREYPIVVGTTDDTAQSKTSVWWQPTTNDWTIVATKEKISCVIGSGKDLKIVPYKTGKSI